MDAVSVLQPIHPALRLDESIQPKSWMNSAVSSSCYVALPQHPGVHILHACVARSQKHTWRCLFVAEVAGPFVVPHDRKQDHRDGAPARCTSLPPVPDKVHYMLVQRPDTFH
jgi:hypothetical protein